MTEFGQDLQELLRAAEIETDATPDDRARMRRRLAKRLGAAAITASTAGSVSAQASAGATVKFGAWLAKGVKLATVLHGVPLALAIGATAAVPVVHAVRRSSSATIEVPVTVQQHAEQRPSPRPTPVPEPLAAAAPVRSEPTAERPPVLPPAQPTAERIAQRSIAVSRPTPPTADMLQVAPTTNDPPRDVRPPSGDAAALLEEYTLISRMHRALGARDAPALSLAIDEHHRRFATGVLAEEREAMRAMLECMRASTSERARAIGAKFVEAHPRSLHAARVEASCADRNP